MSKSGDVAEYRSGTGKPEGENDGMNSLKRSLTDSESNGNRKSKVQCIEYVYTCSEKHIIADVCNFQICTLNLHNTGIVVFYILPSLLIAFLQEVVHFKTSE